MRTNSVEALKSEKDYIIFNPNMWVLSCGKKLVRRQRVSYKEIDISSDPELRGQMMTKANGSRTVPQIFINDAHLGGFSDLYSLQQSGTLDKLLPT